MFVDKLMWLLYANSVVGIWVKNQDGLFNNQLLLPVISYIMYMPIYKVKNHDVSSWNMSSRNC